MSIIVMPTIVLPAPQGRTIVPKPVPGPLSPTSARAAPFWYSRISSLRPLEVVSRRETSSGSPSARATSSFTGQPAWSKSCLIVPRSVSFSRNECSGAPLSSNVLVSNFLTE